MTKDYGKIFLSSLPPMRRSRDIEQTLDFLNRIRLESQVNSDGNAKTDAVPPDQEDVIDAK